MLLPRFQVHRAHSVEEALGLKSELGDDAAFYAGGTELLIIMKLGLAEYAHLIDLKRVPELAGISIGSNQVSIGASVTHDRVATDGNLQRAFPSVSHMAAMIGNSRVRVSGTIGGNLAFGDPHSDPATFLTAMGGVVNISDVSGARRSVPAAEFTAAPYTTVLDEGEMILSVDIPVPGPGDRVVHRHLRFRERPALTVTAAANGAGVSVAVGSVIPVPVRLPAVEELVRSGETDKVGIKSAAANAIEPIDDLDGSADYKRALASEMVARAVTSVLAHDEETEPWN